MKILHCRVKAGTQLVEQPITKEALKVVEAGGLFAVDQKRRYLNGKVKVHLFREDLPKDPTVWVYENHVEYVNQEASL